LYASVEKPIKESNNEYLGLHGSVSGGKELMSLDHELLLTLNVLLQEKNVTRAAARLGVSQSTLSARLTRLRRLLSDPLFVTADSGRGVVPTPRAVELQTDLPDLLERLNRIVAAKPFFDPATTQRTFVVAIHENPAVTLSPSLVSRLALTAPGARIAFVLPSQLTLEKLEAGEIDILVSGSDDEVSSLIKRPLFKDDFLTAQRKGHPRGTGVLGLEEYCALDHLIVSTEEGAFTGFVDQELAKLGLTRRVSVSIQHYALAPVVLVNSNCVCTLPRRFLMQFSHTLDFQKPPLKLPRAQLSALWHRRNQEDAGHVWLRDSLYEAAAEIPLPERSLPKRL
jgi:DNA-binding transcriptional LysR family regulator